MPADESRRKTRYRGERCSSKLISGRCPFWRRKSTPQFSGASRPTRPRYTEVRDQPRYPPATRLPDRETDRPAAMSGAGPHRARATQINVPPRADGAARASGASHSPTELRHVHPTTKTYEAVHRIRCGLTKMQISCRAYRACAPINKRFHSRTTGRLRPHGIPRLCALSAAFAG